MKRWSRQVVLRTACRKRELRLDSEIAGIGRTIYGDGSAGAKVVATSETLTDGNLRYTDFTIKPGAVLTVPSGTVIRCTGSFTNEGWIKVGHFASGALRLSSLLDSAGLPAVVDPAHLPAHPGLSRRAAMSGQTGEYLVYGGEGGLSIGEAPGGQSALPAQMTLLPGPNGGGGGGAGASSGGDGGGTLTVLAQVAITTDRIDANGEGARPDLNDNGSGGGGGAGGVIVLASSGRVIVNGPLFAVGGTGGRGSSENGPGGGGGGGIVHLIAPGLGFRTVDVHGGLPGFPHADTPLTAPLRYAGGGGGAGGGDGGRGGQITFLGVSYPAAPGQPGVFVRTRADPLTLY